MGGRRVTDGEVSDTQGAGSELARRLRKASEAISNVSTSVYVSSWLKKLDWSIALWHQSASMVGVLSAQCI